MNERVQFNLNGMIVKIKDAINELNLVGTYIGDVVESQDFGDLMAIEPVLYRIERDIEDLKYAYDKANERWDEGEDE